MNELEKKVTGKRNSRLCEFAGKNNEMSNFDRLKV